MTLRGVWVFIICTCAGFGGYGVIAQDRFNETCGTKTSNNHYPWLVSIEYQRKSSSEPITECSGALIHYRHVISNAKCITDGILYYAGAEVLVRLGPYSTVIEGNSNGGSTSRNFTDDGVIKIPVERVIIHNEYMTTSVISCDIALIGLRKEVQYTDFIQPICLPSADVKQSSAADHDLYLTGLDELNPKINIQAAMAYFDTTECKKAQEKPLLTQDEICAFFFDDVNSCLLKGGLLMNKIGDRYELYGLLTYASNCVLPDLHTTFVDLFLYVNWIRSKILEWTQQNSWSLNDKPILADRPCNGTDEIRIWYEAGKPPGEDNVYSVFIDMILPVFSTVEMQFDSVSTVTLSNSTAAAGRITVRNETFTIKLFRPADVIGFTVRGPPRGTVPYFKFLKINSQEYCEKPKVGYLDKHIAGYKNNVSTPMEIPDGCGRRHVQHPEPLEHGTATRAGDWPWHVAINRLDRSRVKYICGGTLINNKMVLTAARCTTVKGKSIAPEVLSVILGKHNLIGENSHAQEREVFSVIVHEGFAGMDYLENDIALLKLKTVATYNEYVQPACLWSSDVGDRVPTNTQFGSVVGWGIGQSDALSAQLQHTNMPMVSDAICLMKKALHENVRGRTTKFCAGWANETSSCGGDIGGGFLVFIPDKANDDSKNALGAWHVKGILSTSTSIRSQAHCDPNQYAVFTDVGQYTDWIQGHLLSDLFGFS